MNQNRAAGEGRCSALWGKGPKGGSRGSALWGKGGRGAAPVALCAVVLAIFVPWGSASAQTSPSQGSGNSYGGNSAYIPSDLLSQANAAPDQTFKVIVQGGDNTDSGHVAHKVAQLAAQTNHELADAAKKADDAVQQAQNVAKGAAAKAAQAQQDAARTQADAVAKAQKAALTGRKDDQGAAGRAAQDAAAKAEAATQAQQAAAAAQDAVTQAQSADDAAHASVSQLADTILQQQVTSQFSAITGVAATLTGEQIAGVADHGAGDLLSITSDAPVHQTGDPKWSSDQLWPYVSGSANVWKSDKDHAFADRTPSIAIVDSGIESRSDFGSRVIASVNLSSLPNNSDGDGRGHGTFVAGIAAGASEGYTGTDPAANLVNVDVLDDQGMGLTSDIINACQWILDHQAQYDIQVANFSLNSTITAPFFIDPLDRAVEQLWFHGIVVVAAAGNYGSSSGPSGVLFSPADDPFVVTVGAEDLMGTPALADDTAAPWSAWGYTVDGFAKPELSAPGRYMIGPVPAGSTLVSEHPEGVLAPGYIQLSGTSFAAPVVSGVAAEILAKHPDWTPDQVKGALMLSARQLPAAATNSAGVGAIRADGAVNGNKSPNPNQALDRFVVASKSRSGRSYSFDSAAWNSAVRSNAAWNSASWNSAAWNSASWNSAAWNSAAWNSAAWNSAAWNSAAWNSAAWNSNAHEDGAGSDPVSPATADLLSSSDRTELLSDPDLDQSMLPSWLAKPTK